MNYVTFIIRNLENVPGKLGVGQGEVREKSGIFFCQSLWEPCYYAVNLEDNRYARCFFLACSAYHGCFAPEVTVESFYTQL